MNATLKSFARGISGSYSQIFFSDNPWLGMLVLAATLLDPMAGLSGLIAVVFALLVCHRMGFNAAPSFNGSYTFNVLLMSVALGAYYKFTLPFVVFLLLVTWITLLFTVWLSSLSTRLPFLSLPFVLGVWVVILNVRLFHFTFLDVRPLGEILPADGISQQLETMLPPLAGQFLKAMSAIFFQHNLVAGLLITIGILYWSRIAFSLTVLGFFCGFFFFRYVPGLPANDEFGFIGFNYVLTALALGGFFFIPSRSSFLLAIVATPVVTFLSGLLIMLLAPYALPVYSLPFTLTVIIILAALQGQVALKRLRFVYYQLFSPEKNSYAYHTYMERFRKDTYVHIHLPFYGEWNVSQGHASKLTHKDDWRFAWDFVVTDDQGKTYRDPGTSLSDYYCYSLPVLAPADGKVVLIRDGIEENGIGDVNLKDNWGNTIIIQHGDHLYSKISHIKNGSFAVKQGDTVKKGERIGMCGNSGRSPEPHIHFQLQSVPDIGAKTIEYPVSYYISRKDGHYRLSSFDYPQEGETLIAPRPTPLLKQAFHFIPGMEMRFSVTGIDGVKEEHWEVETDATNYSYLLCKRTGAKAYFTNNGTLFYFNSFTGNKQTLLYQFYLGAHKVLLSYFPGVTIPDSLSREEIPNGFYKIAQDFLAPFVLFREPSYKATFSSADNHQVPSFIRLSSETQYVGRGGKCSFEIDITENSIQKITVNSDTLCITAELI